MHARACYAFLSGLRHAWKEGEVRPTSRKKPPAPRGRRRPDPLAKVTDDLKAWLHEDPSQTGRELLGRLQAAHPDDYPDALIRTVQRRVKIWRGDMARSLVFGPNGDAQPQMTSDALRNLEAARVRGHLQPTETETEKGGHSQEQMVEATT
jgi:hypothetical protein